MKHAIFAAFLIYCYHRIITALENGCPFLEAPLNGYIIDRKSQYTTGEYIKFLCDKGFTMSGTKGFLCTRDFTWNPSEVPKCEKNIALESSITSSTLRAGASLQKLIDGNLDDIIELDCENEPWFQLKFNNYYSISKIILSTYVPSPTHVLASILSSENGEKIGPIVCHFSEEKTGRVRKKFISNCDNNGTWGNEIRIAGACGYKTRNFYPSEIEVYPNIICNRPNEIKNGNFTTEIVIRVGTEVNYTCNENFQLRGTLTRRCLDNGTLSDEEPSCELGSEADQGAQNQGKPSENNMLLVILFVVFGSVISIIVVSVLITKKRKKCIPTMEANSVYCKVANCTSDASIFNENNVFETTDNEIIYAEVQINETRSRNTNDLENDLDDPLYATVNYAKPDISSSKNKEQKSDLVENTIYEGNKQIRSYDGSNTSNGDNVENDIYVSAVN